MGPQELSIRFVLCSLILHSHLVRRHQALCKHCQHRPRQAQDSVKTGQVAIDIHCDHLNVTEYYKQRIPIPTYHPNTALGATFISDGVFLKGRVYFVIIFSPVIDEKCD